VASPAVGQRTGPAPVTTNRSQQIVIQIYNSLIFEKAVIVHPGNGGQQFFARMESQCCKGTR